MRAPDLPVPSGLGLSPADGGYPGSFKDNMQQIIDAINAAGKEVCIAKPPITLGRRPQYHAIYRSRCRGTKRVDQRV
jgi:hypothetical protein